MATDMTRDQMAVLLVLRGWMYMRRVYTLSVMDGHGLSRNQSWILIHGPSGPTRMVTHKQNWSPASDWEPFPLYELRVLYDYIEVKKL